MPGAVRPMATTPRAYDAAANGATPAPSERDEHRQEKHTAELALQLAAAFDPCDQVVVHRRFYEHVCGYVRRHNG